MMEWVLMLSGIGAVTAAIAAGARASHGLWWDDGRSWTLENWPRLCAELKSIGIDHIVVNTNGHKNAIAGLADGRWTAEHLGRLARAKNAPRVHAMVWAAPTKAFHASFARFCGELHQAGIGTVELDIERDAWGTALVGFASREEAARALVQTAIEAGLRIGVTMIPERVYAGFERADYIAVQSYSRYHDGLENHAPGGAYGPGNMQRRGATAAKRAGLPLVQGLAAYDQTWAGKPFGPEMRAAYDAARSTSRVIRWWSSKWVIGHYAQPAVRRMIEKLIQA